MNHDSIDSFIIFLSIFLIQTFKFEIKLKQNVTFSCKSLNISIHDGYFFIRGGLAANNTLPETELIVLTTDNGYVK